MNGGHPASCRSLNKRTLVSYQCTVLCAYWMQCIHKSFPSREHHFYFHRLHRAKHIKKLWLNHFPDALIVRGLLHCRALDTIQTYVWQLELDVNPHLPRCWSPHRYV